MFMYLIGEICILRKNWCCISRDIGNIKLTRTHIFINELDNIENLMDMFFSNGYF